MLRQGAAAVLELSAEQIEAFSRLQPDRRA
jgi:hypothetical protein